MKESEKVFNEQYESCCRELGIKVRKLKQYVTLEKEKLGNSGILEKSIYKHINELFNKFQNDVLAIMDKIEKEFKKELNLRFLKKFEVKNLKVIESNFEYVYKSLEESDIRISETTKVSLNVLKDNININIVKNIKEKNESIIRIRKLEKSKSGFFSKIIEWILNHMVICGFIALISLIVSIASTCYDNKWIDILKKFEEFLKLA